MNVPNNLTSIISVLSIFLSIAGLVISPASSTMLNAPPNEMSGAVAQGIGHHGIFNASLQTELLQTMISKLGEQGVDVSQAQTNLTSGNMTEAMQWLMAYHKEHPEFKGNVSWSKTVNSTLQSERLQTMISKLGEQGVDVSQAPEILQPVNKCTLHSLLAMYKNQPGIPVNSTRLHAWNSTFPSERLQTMISKLGEQGVDVSQAQTNLTSGNMTEAMQWLRAYHKDHSGTLMNKTGSDSGNISLKNGRPSFAGHHAQRTDRKPEEKPSLLFCPYNKGGRSLYEKDNTDCYS